MKAKTIILLFSVLAVVFSVNASAFDGTIPESDTIIDVGDTGNWVDWLVEATKTLVGLIIWGLGIYAVVQLLKSGIEMYRFIPHKHTWMDLGGHVVGGIILIAFIFFIGNFVMNM